MKLVINSQGKLEKLIIYPFRVNLPYYGIARRISNSPITYDKEIDVSAFLSGNKNI